MNPIVQIKRRPSAAVNYNEGTGGLLNGLLEGELGYIVDGNALFIGTNGIGEAPTLLNEYYLPSSVKWVTSKTTGPQLSIEFQNNNPIELDVQKRLLTVGEVPLATSTTGGTISADAQTLGGHKTFNNGATFKANTIINDGTSDVITLGTDGIIKASELQSKLQYSITINGVSFNNGGDVDVGVMQVSCGGTGKNSWSPWGLLVPTASTTIAQVTAGSTTNQGQYLISNGEAVPGWTDMIVLPSRNANYTPTKAGEIWIVS